MDRYFNKFLLWLLIALVPIQGMAAIAKANCGPRHHMASVSASTESQISTGHIHTFHEEHALGASHSFTEPATGAILEDDAADADQSGRGLYASYCGACAACCTGAVAPPVSLSTAAVAKSAEDIAIPPPAVYLGFVPSGLERPPKTFSA